MVIEEKVKNLPAIVGALVAAFLGIVMEIYLGIPLVLGCIIALVVIVSIAVVTVDENRLFYWVEVDTLSTKIDGTTVQSLKNCSACSIPLGPNALVCPKCGEPTQKFSNSFGTSFFLKWMLAGLLLFVILYILGQFLFGRSY